MANSVNFRTVSATIFSVLIVLNCFSQIQECSARRHRQRDSASSEEDEVPSPGVSRSFAAVSTNDFSYGYTVNSPVQKNHQSVQQTSRDGVVTGHYSFLDAVGNLHVTEYTADSDHGYRAKTYTVPNYGSPSNPTLAAQKRANPFITRDSSADARKQGTSVVTSGGVRTGKTAGFTSDNLFAVSRFPLSQQTGTRFSSTTNNKNRNLGTTRDTSGSSEVFLGNFLKGVQPKKPKFRFNPSKKTFVLGTNDDRSRKLSNNGIKFKSASHQQQPFVDANLGPVSPVFKTPEEEFGVRLVTKPVTKVKDFPTLIPFNPRPTAATSIDDGKIFTFTRHGRVLDIPASTESSIRSEEKLDEKRPSQLFQQINRFQNVAVIRESTLKSNAVPESNEFTNNFVLRRKPEQFSPSQIWTQQPIAHLIELSTIPTTASPSESDEVRTTIDLLRVPVTGNVEESSQISTEKDQDSGFRQSGVNSNLNSGFQRVNFQDFGPRFRVTQTPFVLQKSPADFGIKIQEFNSQEIRGQNSDSLFSKNVEQSQKRESQELFPTTQSASRPQDVDSKEIDVLSTLRLFTLPQQTASANVLTSQFSSTEISKLSTDAKSQELLFDSPKPTTPIVKRRKSARKILTRTSPIFQTTTELTPLTSSLSLSSTEVLSSSALSPSTTSTTELTTSTQVQKKKKKKQPKTKTSPSPPQTSSESLITRPGPEIPSQQLSTAQESTEITTTSAPTSGKPRKIIRKKKKKTTASRKGETEPVTETSSKN